MWILGAAATTPVAAALRDAGADRVIAYHSSDFRRRGLPSVAGLLPWASANEQTLRMLPAVVEGVGDVPALATVCASDGLIPRAEMLARSRDLGAAGVLNAPTVGLLEGAVRQVLEAEGLGRRTELELIEDAVRMGLEAWAYVFDAEWVRSAIAAGATGLILHLGITGYSGGADAEAQLVADALAAARQADPDVPLLLHGGSLRHPSDIDRLRALVPAQLWNHVAGFMGASAFERGGDPAASVRAWRGAIGVPAGTDR